ncbi:MAG TPA: Mrp/NBP35 family ATP-binding protein [Candidatus Acidoferrales bacterium]|nr:Mrp/NBP35 family ATP-binding protein [Candidatus Acidoferrales bacterium]
MTTINDIRERLSEVRPPGLQQNIVELGMVRAVDTADGTVIIRLQPPPMPPSSLRATLADIERAVGALPEVRSVDVRVEAAGQTVAVTPGGGDGFKDLGPLPGVRDIIAVSSTKGGVGKSTVAVNLALALTKLRQRVGLLDADVYGPSLPIMFGLSDRPRVDENKRIAPLEKYGLRLMSIGFFLDDTSPVIWRGPLVMGLVRQFLKDVDWGELDVLVVDMPPGTGDAQLTLVQQVPLSGAVVVTTPQVVATLDVQRGIAMFRQVNAPVLGIVENMSSYQCPKCGTEEHLFGSGGGAQIAERFDVPVLGRIPLVAEVRSSGDAGVPIVVDRPGHPVSQVFAQIAAKVLDAVEAERLVAPPPTIIG